MSATATISDVTTGTFVTDGGLETDLIYNHGIDLPGFAAFPLVDDAGGRRRLADYYTEYAQIARRAGASLLLETPTWMASPDRAGVTGYDAAALDRVNRAAVVFLRELTTRWDDIDRVLISGQLGPRGDGYRPDGEADPDEAADYHRPQLAAFAAAGADLAGALTLTNVGEAIGISRAAADVGIPVAISFTVERDGRLPGGSTLAEAVEAVDAVSPPAYFMVNCAHPTHIAPGLSTDGVWRERIHGLRVNASTMSHAELDESDELDAGDPFQLARGNAGLRGSLPALRILGGCCGTDARHVAAMWSHAG